MTSEKKTFLVSLGAFIALLAALVIALPLCLHTTGCTPAARSEADVIATDITDFACSPLDPLDASEYVRIACVGAKDAEWIVRKVSNARAKAILAKHPADAGLGVDVLSAPTPSAPSPSVSDSSLSN